MEPEKLLSFGILKEELPPCFSTEELGQHYDNLKVIVGLEKESACTNFTAPRLGNFRRNFAIPNPIHQLRVIENICTNWPSIQTYLSSCNLSTTKPVEDLAGRIPVKKEHTYPEFKDMCEMEAYQFKYKLKLDIAAFYPSIYTHTIGWALHGRANGRNNSLFGNQLDTLVRNTNKKQSVGIPTGPVTSLIVSEIVATSLDLFIKDKFPNIVGFRYVDDLTLYFENRSDAEKCLELVESFLNERHLSLNTEKTYISETTDPTSAPWVALLSSFEISQNTDRQRDSIKHFFSLIFDLSSSNKVNIPRYGVSKILRALKDGEIAPENCDISNSLLFRLCLHYPNCLDRVFTFIDENREFFDFEMIKKLCIQILKECAATHKNYEIMWCLWILTRLEMGIDDMKLIDKLSMRTGLETIQLLDMNERNLLVKNPIPILNQLGDITDENWLLIYMLEKRGWKPLQDTQTNPFFKRLFDLDVTFFEPSNDNLIVFDSDSSYPF